VVLVTSRQPLGIPGEQVISLRGLPDDEATRLFIDRAAIVESPMPSAGAAATTLAVDTRVIGEICARLDRLPLAIELAAARASSMSLTEIRDRLDDRFRLLHARGRGVDERHQTLRAAVQWSADLLDERVRIVFHRLSVFHGGFLSDAAASVCEADGMDDLDVIDVLDALVARSMVVADRTDQVTRYSLLDTLREYGHEQLAVNGDLDTCRRRHAHHYLTLAERARRQLSTVDAGNAMAVLGGEWDNLRVASAWFSETGDVDGALRTVIAASPYATQTLHLEMAGWAERSIALDGAPEHPAWPPAAAIVAGFRLGAGDLAGSCALAPPACEVE
jgi:predicted ATPase